MKYLIGNWKMNLGVTESLNLLVSLIENKSSFDSVEVVICPSLLALVPVFAKNKNTFSLGAQNCFYADEGDFTGEVSSKQLEGFVKYCLIGHSERRRILKENNKDINLKVKSCLRNSIKPIICVGETLNQKQSGETEAVLRDQIDGMLMGVPRSDIKQTLIAYEPVWAVGKGITPDVNDIEYAINIIKTQLVFMYGESSVPVLYGGSVDDTNADNIMSLPQVSGLLVGGSSLNAEKFAIIGEIIKRGSGLTWSQT